MIRSRLLLSLPLFCGAAAHAQIPNTDVGFSEKTPQPDVDLVVVRERSYGAEGVDLTAYDIGPGSSQYVQSIYVRLRKGSGGGPARFRERISFPPGVEILGVITDGALLGGNADDGALTELDAIFGIDPLYANDYSAPSRGFESDDFAYVASSREVFFVHGITSEVDDARIIIGYGTSFPAAAVFDVEAPDVGVPSADFMSLGVRVGGTGGTIPGSGDFGEARSVLGIPLVGSASPELENGFQLDVLSTVFLARSDGDSNLDAFDVNLGFPIPAVMRTNSPSNGSAFAQGPNNSLFAIGFGTGAGYFQLESGTAVSDPLNMDLNGNLVGVTGDGGDTSIWLARDRGNGNSHVDRVRASNMTVQDSYTISSATLPEPVGITNAADGMLYVLGKTGELIRFDPMDGSHAAVWITGQGGDYAEIGRNQAGSTLYLLRDAGTTSEIDVFDVASATGQVASASLLERSPTDITGGRDGDIYVIGDGDETQPQRLWIVTAAGVVTDRLDMSGLEGDLFGVSDFFPGGFGVNYCGPAIPNSSGRSGLVRADGDQVAGGTVRLSAWSLPIYQIGFFLVGQGTGTLFPVPGSGGRLCLLGANIGRFNGPNQVMNTGVFGRMFVEIDSSALPLGPGTAVMAGETWNFQAWFRDNAAGTSHFTDATAVTFL